MAPRYPKRPSPNSKKDELELKGKPVLCYICGGGFGMKGMYPMVKISDTPKRYVHSSCQ